jgi:cell division protein FtsW (lipid II flippase)
MPDLVTHVAAAYLLRKPLRISKYAAILFTGTILPDVLTRPFYILIPNLYWFVFPFHTPFLLTFVCWLISYLFEERVRRRIFMTLMAGVCLHLLLDLFQKNLIDANYWLFPFSDMKLSVGLFWQEHSVYAIPFLLAIIIVIEIFSSHKIVR